ncbi:MAG: hypothetical protein IKD85_06075 [Firmicutes bacterium]|nr:hypothetical protein [Bacillota bacterium]
MNKNTEDKKERKFNLKTIVICVAIIAVLVIGGLAIHASRSAQQAENDTHIEFDLGDGTAGAID